MGYMERLGLWGAGNPAFSSFADFMDAVGSRGVCALELVAMDMKAQGMYVARTLSYAGARLVRSPVLTVVGMTGRLSLPERGATILSPCIFNLRCASSG